jgi:mannose-6-phosphate isomerase
MPAPKSKRTAAAGPGAAETRPWGRFTVLDEGSDYKVKRIEVSPGKRLSFQKHSKRSEHWVIVEGTGRVTLGTHQIIAEVGHTVEVPVETPHRVENIGKGGLVFIEVQRGSYLGEDDIVRLQDDFGRAPRRDRAD